jgi:hypothetical protein
MLTSEAVAERLAHEPGRGALGSSEDDDLTAAASVERAALLVTIRLVLEHLSHGPERVAAIPLSPASPLGFLALAALNPSTALPPTVCLFGELGEAEGNHERPEER